MPVLIRTLIVMRLTDSVNVTSILKDVTAENVPLGTMAIHPVNVRYQICEEYIDCIIDSSII